jgi:hypothetical protein
MASTYSTDLKLELMATGENSGTWGTKTNTNLNLIQQAIAGYEAISIAGGVQTTALAMTDATISNARNAVIKFTGAITGNQTVTIADGIEKVYIIENATSGAYTVEFKTVSGSGVTWSATDKGVRILYSDGTNVVDSTVVSTAAEQTISGKTLTAPKIADAGFIADANGLEQIVFQTTASAVNELEVTNAATGNAPQLAATGDDTNISLNLLAKGTGSVQSNGSAVKVAGKETMWVPAAAMYATTTNGADGPNQVELTAGQPEVKSLDFAADADDFAQFSVAMPKSWNEGTLTYQPYWSVSGSDAGTVQWGLQAVAISDDEDIDSAFGTVVLTTAKAASGTADDLMISAESGAMTVGGSPAAGDNVFFQIYRDVSGGSQTDAARLIGIKIFFTTDAANDA